MYAYHLSCEWIVNIVPFLLKNKHFRYYQNPDAPAHIAAYRCYCTFPMTETICTCLSLQSVFLYQLSGFKVVSTNSNDAHAYVYACSPNDGSKIQLNNYFSTPLMP